MQLQFYYLVPTLDSPLEKKFNGKVFQREIFKWKFTSFGNHCLLQFLISLVAKFFFCDKKVCSPYNLFVQISLTFFEIIIFHVP